MKRAVRTLIRIIAAAFIVFGGIEVGLDFFRRRLHEDGISWWQVAIGVGLIAAGIGLFAASARLAEKFTDDFEE